MDMLGAIEEDVIRARETLLHRFDYDFRTFLNGV